MRILVSLLLVVAIMSAAAMGQARKANKSRDLSRLTVPDDETAVNVVKAWLTARGIECTRSGDIILLRRQGVLTNIHPIVYQEQIDRLLITVYYNPEEEFQGAQELVDLAVELNRSQNVFRVFVDDDGDLGVSTNMSFYDEFSAKEFDAFMDLVASVVKEYIITDDALKLLK